jgi:hypothetical protein
MRLIRPDHHHHHHDHDYHCRRRRRNAHDRIKPPPGEGSLAGMVMRGLSLRETHEFQQADGCVFFFLFRHWLGLACQ